MSIQDVEDGMKDGMQRRKSGNASSWNGGVIGTRDRQELATTSDKVISCQSLQHD